MKLNLNLKKQFQRFCLVLICSVFLLYQSDINNLTALMSVFMQKALESATHYTINSGRNIVSSRDISMALKREMFIFMEREDIEEKANVILDEIEMEQNIKENLNEEDLQKFEELEEDILFAREYLN